VNIDLLKEEKGQRRGRLKMNWGKRSGKSEEAGECNTWGGGKPANMAKSD